MKYLVQSRITDLDVGIYAGCSEEEALAAASEATGKDAAQLKALSLNNLFVVGKVYTGQNGSWFVLADERAGLEGNLFESREAAKNALKFLGWAYEIYPGHDVAHLL